MRGGALVVLPHVIDVFVLLMGQLRKSGDE